MLKPIKQFVNKSLPSIISIIFNKVISLAGLAKPKPPCGPLVELSILFFASNCNIFPKNGVGIFNSFEISLIPIFLLS